MASRDNIAAYPTPRDGLIAVPWNRARVRCLVTRRACPLALKFSDQGRGFWWSRYGVQGFFESPETVQLIFKKSSLKDMLIDFRDREKEGEREREKERGRETST